MPNASAIMTSLRPKLIPFDCYGTLICFGMAPAYYRYRETKDIGGLAGLVGL